MAKSPMSSSSGALLGRIGLFHRRAEPEFRRAFGRCNRRVEGSELTKLLVAKFAPSDHEGPSVNVGAASAVTKKRYPTGRSKISRAS
jgi:hypothetical protein